MKRNKGDGNIIEKKETDQDKVMSENEETECKIGQNHDGNWRFEQYFTKNSPKTATWHKPCFLYAYQDIRSRM